MVVGKSVGIPALRLEQVAERRHGPRRERLGRRVVAGREPTVGQARHAAKTRRGPPASDPDRGSRHLRRRRCQPDARRVVEPARRTAARRASQRHGSRRPLHRIVPSAPRTGCRPAHSPPPTSPARGRRRVGRRTGGRSRQGSSPARTARARPGARHSSSIGRWAPRRGRPRAPTDASSQGRPYTRWSLAVIVPNPSRSAALATAMIRSTSNGSSVQPICGRWTPNSIEESSVDETRRNVRTAPAQWSDAPKCIGRAARARAERPRTGRCGDARARRVARGSSRFRAFAETYRDKIHKKLRNATDPDAVRDVRAELQTARLLLADRRFEVALRGLRLGQGRAGPHGHVPGHADVRPRGDEAPARARRRPAPARR